MHNRPLPTRLIEVYKSPAIDISIGDKSCRRDTVFIEWLWRSVKCEEMYLEAYKSVREARDSLAQYFHFTNLDRPIRR